MNPIRLAPLLCAIAAGLPAATGRAADAANTAAPLAGRLFMTPEWRAHLERQRQLDIRETRSLEGGNLRLDGVVLRSSGKTTVWVNSQPQTESAQDTGVTATLSSRQPGRATLITGSEPPADLKVGASLDRATRERTDGLADGAIRVHPPKQK